MKHRPLGPLGALLAVLVPVAMLMLVASRYPTMIERRIEARKAHERSTQAQTKRTETSLEIILPDGKRFKEGEATQIRESLEPHFP